MRLSKDKKSIIYNDFLTLTDIPAEVFEYKLGNRSALEWLIDQYRIKIDKRSGISILNYGKSMMEKIQTNIFG